MTRALSERLAGCYSGAVFDVLRARGHDDCLLPHTIKPLERDWVVAGPVFTVRGRPEPSISAHDSLLRWTEFLSAAPPGHVVVCQPQDATRALMGELSAETLQRRGVAGYIVDGGCRDTAFIRRIGFPVFCSFSTPRDVVGGWTPEAFQEPVTIRNLSIWPGDYVLGDCDGVVVIPAAMAESVVEATEVVMRTENLVRTAILSGMDPKDAYLRYGKF